MSRSLVALPVLLSACEPSAGAVDLDACAALDASSFDLVDGAASPDDAPIVALGEPTQVNLRASQVNYVSLVLPDRGSVGIFAERDGVISGLEGDDGPLAVPKEIAPSDACARLADAVVMDMPAGRLVVALGPVFQASTWLYADYGEASTAP